MSGILFGGTPGRILSAWRDGRVRLVVSPDIVDETSRQGQPRICTCYARREGKDVRVAERLTDRYPGVDVQPILALIIQNTDVFPSSPLPEVICDDPDDDKFLACALAAGVGLVVSGDRKLRAASGYEGIQVVTLRQFVDRWL